MTRPHDLSRLSVLGQFILDLRLADLRAATQARDETQARISGLRVPAVAQDVSPIAAGQAVLRYEGWADARRRELNVTLARQISIVLSAETEARSAFGRVEALRRLRDRGS